MSATAASALKSPRMRRTSIMCTTLIHINRLGSANALMAPHTGAYLYDTTDVSAHRANHV
jgi:hypothetical protein